MKFVADNITSIDASYKRSTMGINSVWCSSSDMVKEATTFYVYSSDATSAEASTVLEALGFPASNS